MFNLNINIDPQNVGDLTKTLEFVLNLPCMSRAKERWENSSSYVNNNAYRNDNKISELEEVIKSHKNENVKNQKIIKEKEEKISILENKSIESEKEYKKLENELLDELNKNEKKDEEHKKEIEQCKSASQNKLSQKDAEIVKLKKLLESYSVSFGSDDTSDKTYFEVTNEGLGESTISVDSLYCANKKGDHYIYSINVEGPLKAAISNIEKEIEPFCTIQDRVEGANWANLVTVGEAKLVGSHLQIIKPVVISLIKQ